MAGAPPVVEGGQDYPLTFSVDYPDRELNRLSSFFRLFTVIPIAIVLGTVGGGTFSFTSGEETTTFAAAGGLLLLGPLLMLLFRKKYPVWWANWNRELLRFGNRVETYFALMNDQYPSTDEEQWVHLDFPTPDGQQLSRRLPLVKWLLAIPHYIVLIFLTIAAVICVIIAWVAILFTGRYPRSLFEFVEGVIRWHNRVIAYMLILVTDRYPPFSLQP
jgi:LPXTG-motif cell wall-anchored protein